MKPAAKRKLFFGVYLLLILSPLIVLLAFPRPEWRSFWRDLSVALGFVGFSMMGLQFLPTARLPFFSDALDLDRLYEMHHFISVLSFFLVLLHPLILFVYNPETLRLLNFFTAPSRARWGLVGLAGLFLLVITSVLRKQIRMRYDTWHVAHEALTLMIVVTGLVHMFKVNYYMAVPAQRVLWIFLIGLWSALALFTRLVRPVRQLGMPYEVREVRPEASNTWSLALNPVGHARAAFRPGQVAWLTVRRSPFSLHRNPFSISSSAACEDCMEFTIKELGDFTRTIHDLKPGDRVYVEGPFGTFRIDDPDVTEMVLIAGGIGVAPIMSILRTLADLNDQRPVTLFYGSLNQEHIIFAEEIERLARVLNLKVVHVLEKPLPGWEGRVGYITQEVLAAELPEKRAEAAYFMCGPLPMIHFVEASLKALGVPSRKIQAEKYEMA